MSTAATAEKGAKLDIPKLRAIAARLASEFDGEVLNAARLLVNEARKAGLKPEQLISNPIQPVGTDAFLSHFAAAAYAKAKTQWVHIRNEISLKSIGNKRLSPDESRFIFLELSQTYEPNGEQLGKLFAIAMKLGIV